MENPTPEFHFDENAANIAVLFFERFLHHSKGEWAGRPFQLEQWQKDQVIRPLFGWKRADGTRRYRRAYIEIPRKNGKSTLGAAIALALLYIDSEPGAEVYSAASDREQAAIVFNEARAMVETSPELLRRSKPFRRSIVVPGTRSSYRVLSADAPHQHGLNAHGIVFDELHTQPDRELWDVLNTSTGARRQPLVVMLTTAGYDRESICWEQHEYARQILQGIVQDDSFFACIYGAEESDDWLDPATWRKANPNLGVTISLDYLEGEARRAQISPAYQNTFRRLHLNQWCVILGTMIAMESGEFKRVEDLIPGDRIVAFDEKTQTLTISVVKSILDNGVHPVYRITTKRGRSITTTGNHPFWCRTGRSDSPKYSWIDALSLRPGDRVGIALGWPDGQVQSEITEDQARFLGIMIGDGAMTDHSPRITSIDPGVLEFCRDMAEQFGVALRSRGDHPAQFRFPKKIRGGRQPNSLKQWLIDQKVWGKNVYSKRVPEFVWVGGKKIWAAFLSGYLDTDGCVAEEDGNTAIIWVSANLKLLEDCQQLLAMLGAQSNLRQGRTGEFPSWRLEVHERRSQALLRDSLTPVHSAKKGKLKSAKIEGGRDGAVSLDRFRFDPIQSIEILQPENTIGVEVEAFHTHITNGFITHNTQQETRWLPIETWDTCNQPVDAELLKGAECYGGLDLASSSDIAAFVLDFPNEPGEDERHAWLPFFWIPEANMIERARKDRVPYDAWVRAGLIKATPGNVIDYRQIVADIIALGEKYNIKEIAFDRWGAVQISQELMGAGYELVGFGQGFQSMAPPMKDLLRLVMDRKLAHGGNPVLRWMADNLVVRQDPAGNVKPDKAKSREKIDGIVGGLMALDRASRHQGGSVYDERGLITL